METNKAMNSDQFVAWMRGYTTAKGWENIGREENVIIAEMLATTTLQMTNPWWITQTNPNDWKYTGPTSEKWNGHWTSNGTESR